MAQAFSPSDARMGLVDGLYSKDMAQHRVWLSGLLTFEQCAEVFARIGQCAVNSSRIWRRFQKYGAGLVCHADQQQAQVSPERTRLGTASTDHALPKGVSLDGGMVNLRGEGWKEMKVGTVYDVTLQLEKDERSGDYIDLAHAPHIAYRAVLGDVEAFCPALWALAVECQVPNAQHSSVTADGAEWIWNVSADLFPDSVQIVDWYHATSHLSDAANALFPDNPTQAQHWRTARHEDLFLGNIHAITAPLDKANLADHSHSFHTHQRRMQYHEFRENSLPIGSGAVESSVKQFKAPLAGPAMQPNACYLSVLLSLTIPSMNAAGPLNPNFLEMHPVQYCNWLSGNADVIIYFTIDRADPRGRVQVSTGGRAQTAPSPRPVMPLAKRWIR